ncbi:hypothetical protein GIB67_023511 [Kingdonia uniflora]|uniref:Uncharacterized protein n=1 Tax=Kingdonia uniflora TaxID=39325 RepID=A0A7J7PA55_9MAGN|nr:hypothetical protein GIB67_023511 [Kingdonia uniflora]
MLIKQYFLDGIKNSGPTTDGDGHGYTNAAKTLSGRKVSGPSPDVGHKFTTVQTLGGVKDAGPSPGNGHKYITLPVVVLVVTPYKYLKKYFKFFFCKMTATSLHF